MKTKPYLLLLVLLPALRAGYARHRLLEVSPAANTLIQGSDESSSRTFIYSTEVVAQALTWILLGLMAYPGLGKPEEQRLPLHQDQR